MKCVYCKTFPAVFQQENNASNVFCSKNCHIDLLIKVNDQEIINDPELFGIILKSGIKVHIRKSHAIEMELLKVYIEENGTDNYMDLSSFMDEESFNLLIKCTDLIQNDDPTLRAWVALFKDIEIVTFFNLIAAADFFGYNLLLYNVLFPRLFQIILKWDIETVRAYLDKLRMFKNALICYFFQKTDLIQSQHEKLLVLFPEGIPDPIESIIRYGYDRILYFMYNHNHDIIITGFQKYVLMAIELDRVNIMQVFLLVSLQRNPVKIYFDYAAKHNKIEVFNFLLSKSQPPFDKDLLLYTISNKFSEIALALIKKWNVDVKDIINVIIENDVNVLRNLLQLDLKLIETVKKYIISSQLMKRDVIEVLYYTMMHEEFKMFLFKLKEIGSTEMINFIEEFEGWMRSKRTKIF